jgi:UDP-2-acetamido-3-amino-2,3-dideoxy-glucuronate N-acetyltransferase
MTERQNERDDHQILKNVSFAKKILLGLSMYIPSSTFKKTVLKLLGAHIGKNVYFGPGSLVLSNDYNNVYLGDNVFVAPGTLINVNKVTIGDNSHLGYQCLLVGESLKIGSRCNISNRTFIECSFSPIFIEDDVTIGASAMVSSHDGSYKQTHGLEMKAAPISIRKKAFIGNNAIVLPSIEIGEKAIVGAGAVVTKDVPQNSVIGGVPARLIKDISDNDIQGVKL